MKNVLALLLVAFALPALAGGTFDVDKDLAPVRQQIPELWGAVTKSFDLAPSGMASRVGANVNARLGGLRVGPWCIPAKPKGAAGPYTYEVCLNTDATWLDAKGKTVDLGKAVKVEEKFSSIEIRPMPK